MAVAALVAAAAFGWLVMTGLGRLLRAPAAPPAEPVVEAPAVRRLLQARSAEGPQIKATLFFASEDGQRLIGVQQDVPLAEGTVAQARALIEALLSTTRAGSATRRTMPEGTTLRGVYVSDRSEVFVDLDATVRDQAPGRLDAGAAHRLQRWSTRCWSTCRPSPRCRS